MSIQPKIGWFTSFELPSKHGICNWYGCGKPVVERTGFCKKHGKHEINVRIGVIPL